MIALYLLCAHLVGDYLFQSRRMAARKLDEPSIRFEHVGCYLIPFYPIAIWQGWERPGWHAAGFLVGLGVLHFATDSRRFHSSIADWVDWRLDRTQRIRDRFGALTGDRYSLAPNPWPPMPLIIDQTLHLCQIAVLAGIFLA